MVFNAKKCEILIDPRISELS